MKWTTTPAHRRWGGPVAGVALSVVLLVGLFLAGPLPAQTAVPGEARDQAQEAAPPPPPSVFEVAARARLLADSAARAEQTIERLSATSALAGEIADAERRYTELHALFVSMAEMDFVRPERLSRLRDQAVIEDGRLEALRGRIVDRLTQLGELRARWLDHRREWRAWHAQLQRDPDFADVEGDLEAALARIDAVAAAASDAASGLLAFQRRTEELRSDVDQIDVVVTSIRATRREALLERGEPMLLSAGHRADLAAVDWEEWSPLDTIQPRAYLTFGRTNAGLLAFYLALWLVLAFGARRLRLAGGDQDLWGGLLDRPWALGLFGAVVIAIQRITLAPPLWDVLLWSLFAATASMLSRHLFSARALRWTVYLLGVFYPLFLLLEVTQVPSPLFRLGLAGVAAAALPLSIVLARRRAAAAAADESRDPRRIWPLWIGAAMWAVVLVAVVLGYDAFGRWILHATVTSGAVVFVLVLVFTLARAMLPLLLTVAEPRRVVRGAGVRIAQRIILLFQIALTTAAALILLDVWGVAESPVATWQWFVALGFQLGPLSITVGRVITGALVVYAAILISAIARAMVARDVERRHDGDRGLGESISRLVHYAVITLGVIFALGALGMEFQNFAIIAGALGIGVGFGLQNVINNFASGLILLFERPVRVGDTVVIDDVWATIQKIGLRSTVMVTFDQSEMIVPNGDLVSEKVTNWTLSNPTARINLPVGVAYGTSIEQVLSILYESAFAHEAVLKEPPPEALFVGFGDSSLDFELRVWLGNIRRRLQVRSVVLIEVERRLAEAGIEIPFPQRDLHLRSMDRDAARLLNDPTE
jgi:potassium-dependent mechanosensitive channel